MLLMHVLVFRHKLFLITLISYAYHIFLVQFFTTLFSWPILILILWYGHITTRKYIFILCDLRAVWLVTKILCLFVCLFHQFDVSWNSRYIQVLEFALPYSWTQNVSHSCWYNLLLGHLLTRLSLTNLLFIY